VAVIYEDGPYGVSVKEANLLQAKNNQMKVLLTEGYDHKTKDCLPSFEAQSGQAGRPFTHGLLPGYRPLPPPGPGDGSAGEGDHRPRAGYDNFQNLEKQLGRSWFSISIAPRSLPLRIWTGAN